MKARIKSTGQVGTITSTDIQVGSKIYTIRNQQNEIIWNGDFSSWDESQVELIKSNKQEPPTP